MLALSLSTVSCPWLCKSTQRFPGGWEYTLDLHNRTIVPLPMYKFLVQNCILKLTVIQHLRKACLKHLKFESDCPGDLKALPPSGFSQLHPCIKPDLQQVEYLYLIICAPFRMPSLSKGLIYPQPSKRTQSRRVNWNNVTIRWSCSWRHCLLLNSVPRSR